MLFYMLVNDKITASNALLMAGFFLVMFVYLNILRERLRYGDYHYYLEAATALANGQPLPTPTSIFRSGEPSFNTLSLSEIRDFSSSLWTVNIIALGTFYFLLVRILERYNFSHHFAVLTTILFLLVNAPLQRTLGFVQVNLMVLDLVFLSILTYPKNTLLSALTLALAVHLKTSPAVLVLAFLLEFNWRWMFWFAVSFLVIAAIPVLTDGISPYLDYLTNIRILTEIPDTNFHDTSFDSFLRFLNPFFGIQIAQTRLMALSAKVLLLGRGAFHDDEKYSSPILLQRESDVKRHPAALHCDDPCLSHRVGSSRHVHHVGVPAHAQTHRNPKCMAPIYLCLYPRIRSAIL
jgi:hypothetical protein